MNTVRLLDELVSSTHQAVSNQVKAMEELHTRVVSQSKRTSTTMFDQLTQSLHVYSS
jgi:hypothetical protein